MSAMVTLQWFGLLPSTVMPGLCGFLHVTRIDEINHVRTGYICTESLALPEASVPGRGLPRTRFSLASHSGLWVHSDVAPLPPSTAQLSSARAEATPPSPRPHPRGWPSVLGCPSLLPDNGPPRREVLHAPAGVSGVCIVVWLSPPVLCIGLRWPKGSGDEPDGCA